MEPLSESPLAIAQKALRLLDGALDLALTRLGLQLGDCLLVKLLVKLLFHKNDLHLAVPHLLSYPVQFLASFDCTGAFLLNLAIEIGCCLHERLVQLVMATCTQLQVFLCYLGCSLLIHFFLCK